MLKRIIILLFSIVPAVVLAAPVRFGVEVQPNTFTTNTFVDVIVRAIDANGNVDTAYTEYVWMEIEGYEYTDPDIILPAKGVGIFEPSDQGVKIFSKGLTIKKPGKYTLLVADVYDTSIQGTAEIEVLASGGEPEVSTVTVVSPVSGSIESQTPLSVIGSTSFANTPIVILLDDIEIQEDISDANGDFTLFISDVEQGEHTITVNALNLENQVVATSGPIPFTYEGVPSDLFLGLDITPAKEVVVNTPMTFTIRTATQVGSALLVFGDGQPIPTQKTADGEFTKNMTFTTPQELPIEVRLLIDGNTTAYEDVDIIKIVDDTKKILTAEYLMDTDNSKADLRRTYTGGIDYFKVVYGIDQNALNLSLTTSQPQGSLILADLTATYYAQIFPVDANGTVIGDPSRILEIPPLQAPVPVAICGNGILETGEACEDGNTINGDGCDNSCQFELYLASTAVCGNRQLESGEECDDGNLRNNDGCSSFCTIETAPPVPAGPPSCSTDNIRIRIQQIDDRYYLTWSPVVNAEEYVIYRSDTRPGSPGEMTEVGRTTTTRYEYPFDPYAEVDRWAWYAVDAVCSNGDLKQVGDMTQVKVGPEDTLLVVLALAILSVVGIRLRRLV